MLADKPETVCFYRKHLPHWEVARGRYFVTIRLRGAIPEQGLERVRERRRRLEEAVTNGQDGLRQRRAVFREMERWLHLAKSISHLKEPEVADMVVEALEHRVMKGIWSLFSYTAMPNHLHMFLRLGDDRVRSGSHTTDVSLRQVLRGFKEWTAREANRLLRRRGRFWQDEWFDHWSRSLEEDESIERYIRNNPVKAGLARNPADWPWTK